MFNFLKGFSDSKNTFATLYLNANVSLHILQTVLQSFYKKETQETVTFKKTSNGFTVDIAIKNDPKKELITVTQLQFIQNERIVYVKANYIEKHLSSYQEIQKTADFDIKKQAFFIHLQQHIVTLQNDQLYALNNTEQLPFVTTVDLEIKNFIFHLLKTTEYVLSILGASEVHFKIVERKTKNDVWYFVVTSDRIFLVSRDLDHHLIHEELSATQFSLQEKTGKDLISTETVSFYTEFMNDTLYRALLPVIKSSENRLAKFGDLLTKKYSKRETHLALASRLFLLQSTTVDSFQNILKSELAPHVQRGKITPEKEPSWSAVFTKRIKQQPTFGIELIQIVTDWELSFAEQQKILKLLLPFQQKETAQHTIAFHKHVYQIFSQQEKKAEIIFEFNLNYAQHLSNAKQFEDAITEYKMIYSALPDDSITDLLPSSTTNMFKGEGGRQLKVILLEAILNIQKTLNIDTSKTVHELAELQPLVALRIEALQQTKQHQQKAVIIQEILQTKTLSIATTLDKSSYQAIEKKEIFHEVIPSCFKDAKGFFDTLNNFIANLNPPDYNAVISFSDRLDSTNYPIIFQRLTAICAALQMELPECYIGRGTYAGSVIGVEGKPSFLIVGINFLDPKSIRYLEPNALLFLMTTELAHIYFKHSKITATDVWRGAADKGFSLINVLLTLLPFAGSIGTVFGNVAAIEKYGTIIQRVEQVANAAEKGKEIRDLSDKYDWNPFGKKTSQAQTSENLLITSRLMEIIADKVALLFCNDLKAAVKGLLVGTKFYEEYHTNISKIGVQAFLSEINANDEFIHQELIIRLRSLCSFYLSDTFENLKKHVY